MKKTFLISLTVLILIPFMVNAACPTGLVPCGTSDCPCTFCHIFSLIDNVLDFFLMKIALPVAALMIVIGGAFMLLSPARPEWTNKAKSILTSVAIGLVVIFIAFVFIGTILKEIGLAEWTENMYQDWWEEGFFQYPCNP